MSAILEQMLERAKLPNSLLLTGTVTKEQALDLAKKILGPEHERKIDSGNHPDLHLYFPEEKSRLHLMATMQKMIREMALPPFEAKAKIFFLFDAEKMLPATSNALLKTLEEPAEDSYFILTTNRADDLLPTIYSRLHPINFSSSLSASFDLDPFFTMAANEDWNTLFEKLPLLEQQDPESIFRAYLEWIAKNKTPKSYINASLAIEKAQKALLHNLKPRIVFLELFLQES